MNCQLSIVNFQLMKSVPNYVKLVPNELSILNNVSHNPIIINNIPNIFIVLFIVLSCRFGMEAQHAAPLLVFLQLNGELNPRLIRPYKLSIVNSQFSIDEVCA